MNAAEATRLIRRHFEGVFPKVCPKCGRSYETLRDYVVNTRPRGSVVSFDAEVGDWETRQPMGTLAYADCACGNTLALGTETMALPDRLALLGWVRQECEARRVSPTVVLDELRAAVRRAISAPPSPPPPDDPVPPAPA